MTARRQPGRPTLGLVALAIVVAGCAAGPGPASPTPIPTTVPPPSSTPSTSPTTPGVPSPVPSDGLAAGDPAGVAVSLEPIVEGLASPVAVRSAGDGSGRLFVVEQPGRIRIVRDGVLVERPFLDVERLVGSGGERGLLGLAFHPRFGDGDDRIFVDFTDREGTTVIAEARVSSDPDLADASSLRALLRVEQPFPNHNGGDLAFGPDGYLYVALGDGGSGGDPLGNGQRLGTHLGKILRIDVDTVGPDAAYAVPADNPFVDVDGAFPEIWAYGLRNPWRFSFDRATGDLWIADVGQGAIEEVDRLTAADGGGRGVNLGWASMEGSACFPEGTACDPSGLVLPLAEYGHDQGCAVTGGYVYRGPDQPALAGVYAFADYCSGRLWGVASGGPDRQDPVLLAETGVTISSFGEDDGGELYVTDLGGQLLRVLATAR
jgi:glucose/arabinose dehydrogenase